MPARLKQGDEVIVIGGKDRGKRGRILRVEPKNDRVFVEGLNMVSATSAPVRSAARSVPRRSVGVIAKEGPIHVSNVMLADPQDNKPARVGVEIEDGKRFRISRRSKTRLD